MNSHLTSIYISHPQLAAIISHLQKSYMAAIQQGQGHVEQGKDIFNTFIELIAKQLKDPYPFDIFHQAIRTPFDYYQFSLAFFHPLIDFSTSKTLGLEHVGRMVEQMNKGENVILFANHQTEPDPQLIHLLLKPFYPQLTEQMIFVAGHRVRNDPIAVPMSMGCHLLCIYSKRYINHPPEEKANKIAHNQRTMKKMNELLDEGGKCIYVAPSGGRDRPNAQGCIDVAPFDPQSLEMFWLMAQQASKPTHFYPLALATYDLQPPPVNIKTEIGERREVYYKPVGMAFGAEIDMAQIPNSEQLDKKSKRNKRADHIWNLVRHLYQTTLDALAIQGSNHKDREIQHSS